MKNNKRRTVRRSEKQKEKSNIYMRVFVPAIIAMFYGAGIFSSYFLVLKLLMNSQLAFITSGLFAFFSCSLGTIFIYDLIRFFYMMKGGLKNGNSNRNYRHT